MKNIDDRYAYFLDCLTYYDGENFYQFFGKSEGYISYEKSGNDIKKAKSNLWYVFVPKNCKKTLAEMTNYERNNRCDGRTDAIQKFINFLLSKKTNIKKIKIKYLKHLFL